MFCSNCGAELPRDAKFCPKCGTDAKGALAEAKPAGDAGLSPDGGVVAGPAKKKMALWKKILIGVVAFFVLVIGSAFFLTSGLVEPIDRQLAAIKAGNIKAAYSETSIAFQKSNSLERFAGFVKANPALAQVKDRTFTKRSVEGSSGKVTGTLETADGSVIPIEYQLVKESGAWRILSIHLGTRN